MINILKGKSLLAAVLMAVLMLQGCARFRDIRIVSCGVESVSMQGLRSVEAILSVGVDNPAAALELSAIEGTLNMGDDVLGTFSAGNFSIDRKTVSECQVPVSFTLDRQVSLLSLLPLVRELDPDIVFERPALPSQEEALAIRRPELLLYEAQERTLDVRRRGLRSGYLPRFSLFAQGAYGNPGLNFLKDKFGAYYVIGARMNWNFGSLYTLKNDRHKLELERRRIDSERNLFLLDTRLQLAGQEGTIVSLRRQMEKDEEIIRLRANISRSAETKVAEGTLSVTEMLRELAAENLARQTKVQHEVQLLLEVYKQKHLTN